MRQYLDAETHHVLGQIERGDRVLELGCGYGRVLGPIAGKAERVVGVDTARENLAMARRVLAGLSNCELCLMDASRLGFLDRTFDMVVCVQNGISAFRCDRRQLVEEAVRVTRPGGRVLFSTYAASFWPHRLEWFRAQAAEGLIGPIDPDATREGVIACRDGFRSTTVRAQEFLELTARLPITARVTEIDQSSLFCEMRVQPLPVPPDVAPGYR